MRKLAAIMFTDIAGYTTLMGEDESKALQLLQRNRGLLKPIIEQFRGEWLKEIGDGTLSCFSSAVDAVNCALAIQQVLKDDPDLRLRIGIHIGDVVFERGDVFGEGVNVASRIEPLAEPGGICVSERVYDDIRNKPGIETTLLGEQQLKGVDRPVKVYAVTEKRGVLREREPAAPLPLLRRKWTVASLGVGAGATLAVIATLAIMLAAWSWWRTSQDPLSAFEHSVAVMPFDNLTGDEAYDIWERGMVTLLYTSLTTSEELYVLDVQTLFEVIDAIKDAQRAQMIPQLATEVAHRTGVKNVILGDILRAGDRLRLQARLVEVKTGEVVYSPFVEGKSEDDFFAMAQDLADQVKDHLEIKVLAQVKKGYYATGYELDDVLTTSAEAFRHFLRRGDESDPATQVKELTQAVSIDTNFVWAQLQLAIAYNDYAYLGNTAVRIKEARKWARKAYSRKNELPYRYQLMMEVFWCEFEKTPYEQIKWIKKALELNPQNWELWANLGHCYSSLEQYEPAIEPYKKCIELRKQRGYGSKWEADIRNLRYVYHELGEHDKELELVKGLELPGNRYNLVNGAATYLCNGDTAGAQPYFDPAPTKWGRTGNDRGPERCVVWLDLPEGGSAGPGGRILPPGHCPGPPGG